MATLLRGKQRGSRCSIHQFCNNWFEVELVVDQRLQSMIVSPTSLELEPAEINRVWMAATEGLVGQMFAWYDLDRATGRFKRFPRAVAVDTRSRAGG